MTGVLLALASIVDMSTVIGHRQARELARRESDGLAVRLVWHPSDDAVTVSVTDSRTGDRFQLAVDRTHALDAFYHPFAYAA